MKLKFTKIVFLSALLFGLLAVALTARAMGGSCAWNGSVDANWSTPGNWSAGCSGTGGIPGTGDMLTFPAGAANATMTNDLPAIALQSLNFTSAQNYTINGINAINLTGGIDVIGGNQTINAPLTAGGAGVNFHTVNGSNLTFGGPLNLGAYNVSFTVDSASNVVGIKTLGAINGSGAAKISKYGTGELQITGDHSVKTFDIDIHAGSVGTDPTAFTGLPNFGKITIASGANLNTRSGAVIGAISGAGDIHASSYFQIRQLQTTTFTGDIFGNQQMAIVGNNSNTLTIDRSGGSLSYAGEINSNASAKLRIVNTTAASVPDFLVAQGSLELNNSHVGVVLVGSSGGGFNYNGTLILSGTTPSIASSITLRNNSSVISVINSATDYGRIDVASPVDLGAGAPTFALQGGYVSSLGEVFTIIQNANGGFATKNNAAFSNLSQGGPLLFNGNSLQADYLASANTAFTLTDITDFTPPVVNTIALVGANATNAASVDFTVTFSEAVTGVNISDFSLTASGVSGAAISGLSGSGASYIVTVNTGAGNGKIRLDVTDDDSILDAANNPLGGAGASNGNFTNGQTYVIVKTAPVLFDPFDGGILNNLRPTFTWYYFPGATGYNLQVSKSPSFSTLVLNISTTGLNSTQHLPTKDMPANSTVYWRVRAKLSGTTYSAWSAVWSFQTPNPPSIPSLVSPTNGALVNGPSPVFDWKDSTVPSGVTFDSYQIQVATDSGFANIVHNRIINGINNSQDNTAVLNPGVTYYWRVRSREWDYGSYSSWSAVWTVKVRFPAPSLLSPADLSFPGSLKPTFIWTAVPGAPGYSIQISKTTAFGFGTIKANVILPTYTPGSNLSAHTKYYWRVMVSGSYSSGWSVVFSFTTP